MTIPSINVIVAIGENFGASIRVVALLKQKKVPRIFARAIDAVHKAVLEAFDLERILTPEEDAARSLVQLLDFGTNMEGFRIDQDYYVVKLGQRDTQAVGDLIRPFQSYHF